MPLDALPTPVTLSRNPTAEEVTTFAESLRHFPGDDAALVAAIKTALIPRVELLEHSATLAELLAPLNTRGDQVANAVADFFEGMTALKETCDDEYDAFERMSGKVRAAYYYNADWSIVELRKLKKGGGSADPSAQAGGDGTPKQDTDGGDGTFTAVHQLVSPIRFPARVKDHAASTWSLVVSVQGPDAQWQDVVLQQSELYGKGDAWVQKLTAKGLSIQGTTSQLRAILNTIIPAKQIVALDRPGWFDIDGGSKGFMFPTGAIVPTRGAVEYRYTGDPTMGAKFKQAGTLAEWKANVATPAEKNSRLMLALCVSFAGPLLEPLGIEGGGFHLYGSSSIGKTTALAVGASVFGEGRAFVENFRSTDNALENRCLARHHTCLLIDEIGQAKGDLGEIIYLMANGTAKGRMTAGGESRTEKRWLTMFLSTGEQSTEEKIAMDKKSKPTAGHNVRDVDIEGDAGAGHGLFDDLCGAADGAALSDKLKKATATHYGTAGPAFVEWLVDQRASEGVSFEALREKVDELASLFVDKACTGEADGQVRRVAARFALLAVAGELAREAGVTDWVKGAATRAAYKLFVGWIAARGTTGDLEVKRGLSALKLSLAKHGKTKFNEVRSRGIPTPTLRDAEQTPPQDGSLGNLARVESCGFRDENQHGVTYYVLTDEFPSLCGGHAPRKVLDALETRGNLLCGEAGRQATKKRFGGEPRRYYAIFISAGGDNDAEFDEAGEADAADVIDGVTFEVLPVAGQVAEAA